MTEPFKSGVCSVLVLFRRFTISFLRVSTRTVRTCKTMVITSVGIHMYNRTSIPRQKLQAFVFYGSTSTGPQQQDPKSLQAWDCESQLGQRPCFESSSSCTKECKQHPGCWVCCLQKHPTYTSISFTLIVPEGSCQQTPLKISLMKIYVFHNFCKAVTTNLG